MRCMRHTIFRTSCSYDGRDVTKKYTKTLLFSFLSLHHLYTLFIILFLFPFLHHALYSALQRRDEGAMCWCWCGKKLIFQNPEWNETSFIVLGREEKLRMGNEQTQVCGCKQGTLPLIGMLIPHCKK